MKGLAHHGDPFGILPKTLERLGYGRYSLAQGENLVALRGGLRIWGVLPLVRGSGSVMGQV